MARNEDNLYTHGYTGAIGKQMVLKEINGKTFMCKYPDMSQVEYNQTQIEYQKLFAKAVEYAQSVLRDPVKTEAYRRIMADSKNIRDYSVYHVALKDFMRKFSRRVPKGEVLSILQICKDIYKLTQRQEKALKHLIAQKKLTNAIYQQLNNVSKATATRDLQDLVKQNAIAVHGRGAGANYSLVEINSVLHNAAKDDGEYEGLIGSWPSENGSHLVENGSKT